MQLDADRAVMVKQFERSERNPGVCARLETGARKRAGCALLCGALSDAGSRYVYGSTYGSPSKLTVSFYTTFVLFVTARAATF